MVHRYAPIDRFRRTVSRATRPALIPLRAAAASLPDVVRPEDGSGDEPEPGAERPEPAVPHREPDVAGTPAVERDDSRAEELEVMRDHLAAAPDLQAGVSTERAQRATRSASAYLEARRARLKRELRELRERS